ncbi:tetratricopeptide repeat (TPR)-like superfamily protein [Tasmannia lanceolata]|uniref:tetratricopeptide repeat (TPR)-like superfamily protein n=1 Tax=Tasmannia lanceolata TaxID=3420 RepID=UPI004063B499
MEVAGACLPWSQPVVSHSLPTSSQTLSSVISSRLSKRRSIDRALVSRFVRPLDRSTLFGTMKLTRTRSFENQKSRGQTLRRALSDSLEDNFPDDEFVKKLGELAMRFHLSDDESIAGDSESSFGDSVSEFRDSEGESNRIEEDSPKHESSFRSLQNSSPFGSTEPPWIGIRPDPPDWSVRNEIIPASIERKANSVDLPFSLRMLKRKKQWQEGFREAGESAYCSVKKAFSSMVFIIQELQSYTLQMREILFYEDLQGILVRVQKEMNASFVWLFEQVFSRTPTLMVYVMILLANFTVYSMSHNPAIAAAPPPESYTTVLESRKNPTFSPNSVKTFSVSSSVSGKTASVGGSGGNGGKVRPVIGATDGDGRFDESSSLNQHRPILPSETSVAPPVEESVIGSESEREVKLWNMVVEEASRMQGELRDECLDHETMQRFVSPIKAEIEPEDAMEYFRTELIYQLAISQEPENPLILSNYAQFLHLVVHDHDRAEEYFKRAVRVKPADAESLSRYASFLWLARHDINAAEETFLEAIDAEPSNTTHAANYAHFLWNTGGEDTCYPIV